MEKEKYNQPILEVIELTSEKILDESTTYKMNEDIANNKKTDPFNWF